MSCYGVIIGCKDQNSFLYKAVNMLFYIVEVGHSVIQLQVAIRETGISFFFLHFYYYHPPHTHIHIPGGYSFWISICVIYTHCYCHSFKAVRVPHQLDLSSCEQASCSRQFHTNTE